MFAVMQCYFRNDGIDSFPGVNGHQYCTPTSNKMIEIFLSYLRKMRLHWWMNFFKDIVTLSLLLLHDVYQKSIDARDEKRKKKYSHVIF